MEGNKEVRYFVKDPISHRPHLHPSLPMDTEISYFPYTEMVYGKYLTQKIWG